MYFRERYFRISIQITKFVPGSPVDNKSGRTGRSYSWAPNKRQDIIWNNGESINTLRPSQNGRHFADDTFKCIFLDEDIRISFKISLRFVP